MDTCNTKAEHLEMVEADSNCSIYLTCSLVLWLNYSNIGIFALPFSGQFNIT